MDAGGLYIHIPFCEKKCGYCDFYSLTALHYRSEFVDALLKEISLVAPRFSHLLFDTVFFGGGTPTLLNIDQLEKIWSALHKNLKIAADGEFSIEANPGTVELKKLCALRHIGFNRLSMGVQSFQPEDLEFLGRIHTTEEALENFAAARTAGFQNINLDLMTAFPGLTAERFRKTLETTIELQPEHISCYTLIFEPKTPFYTKMKQGILKPVENDREAAFYHQANHLLSEAGYTAYEISNFARKPGWRCRHNLKYWQHNFYLGFGPSAHSFFPPKRWWNARSLSGYLHAMKENKLPRDSEEQLDQKTLEFEYIFLHLRLKEGIDLADYRERFQAELTGKYAAAVAELSDEGMIKTDRQQLRLTQKGWLLADEIAQHF